MYCPNCAKAAPSGQKFCRSCGFNLERTSELLAEQLSGNPSIELRRQEQALEKFGNVVFTGFGIVGAIGIAALIYAVLSRFVLSGTQPLVGLLLAAILLFAAPALAYVFWRESLRAKRANIEPFQPNEIDLTKNVRELDAETSFMPAQSVVESTTELLLVENKTRKLAYRADDESV